jgi:hypothetical protein
MSGLFWNIVLVNNGMEEIKVVSGKTTRFKGRVPAGFAMHLGINDGVYFRMKGGEKEWIKKFAIGLVQGKPALLLSKEYGDSETISLDKLPNVKRNVCTDV